MKQEAYQERRAARLEEEHRLAAEEMNADAVLVRCDNCGLEQVTHGIGNPYLHPCLLCGGETATAIEKLSSWVSLHSPVAVA